jgi:hypothetical protein
MFSPPWFAGIYRIRKEAKSNGLASPPKLLKLRPNLAGASLFSLPRERNVLRGPYYGAPALWLLYHTARRSGRRGRGSHGHSKPVVRPGERSVIRCSCYKRGQVFHRLPAPPFTGRGPQLFAYAKPRPFPCSGPVQSPKPSPGLPQLVGRIIPSKRPISSGTPWPLWTGAMGFLDEAPCEELVRQGEELPSVRSLRYSSWKLRLKVR